MIQPGEEKLPGGASIMIKEGVLNNPDVDAMIGQHVMPLIDAGKVGFRKGCIWQVRMKFILPFMAKEVMAHIPHLNIDPLLSRSSDYGLQQIVSRSAKPAMPSVLSIGKIIGLGATNIIPDKVEMEGTFRTLTKNGGWKPIQKLSSC